MMDFVSDEEFLTFLKEVEIALKSRPYDVRLTSTNYEDYIRSFFNVDTDNPSHTLFLSEFYTARFISPEPVY